MAKQREVAKEKCKTCVWKTKVGTNSDGNTFFCMFGDCFLEKEEKRKRENELKSNLQKHRGNKRI